MSTPQPKTRVALVYGGRSSEHAVSCATAAGVMSAIDTDRFDVVPIGIARDGRWVLGGADLTALALAPGHTPEVTGEGDLRLPLATDNRTVVDVRGAQGATALGDVDVVFPLLHGPFGEDGTLQGMLELADIPYVGCGVLASATMMDKHAMKGVFASHGLPIGPFVTITDRQWCTDPQAAIDAACALTFPLFVKPARAGSSVGITRVHSREELPAAVEAARAHDPKVVVEQGIVGREIECGVLQGRGHDAPRTSLLGEIVVDSEHGFYDFDAKYLDEKDVVLSCPAELPQGDADRIRTMAAEAFEAAGCEGLARVDFFYTPEGDVVVNEINTMPGFTPHSMYPQMWLASGMTYRDLITELIDLALTRRVGLR
ncbi:D-alanine--D-alanine ligase family protein [Mobilicoccus pelagius]|uniref:D-alanine--D-alanine ligase n=1 Tax=Mobilicoccus pelagius NBRC 104925 TaxID=1089455 RepID=H5UNF8_9MICO|nr:D-alanine--D-alanine ligase family protein [Mobilicoccus pelagius]GAB47266.1 D-alanine--D-alanine ligase [Mobilicoccus pelagius NBRC 104925]